ncbi:hypothetical protein GCM10023142_38650 [Anaerocolumna aminovalerica]
MILSTIVTPLSIRGMGCIVISSGIVWALNGIKLKTLSIENGNTSLKPAMAHRQYEMIFGAFFNGSRTRHMAAITNAPVKLIFKIVRNTLSIAAPLVLVYQPPKFLGLFRRELLATDE